MHESLLQLGGPIKSHIDYFTNYDLYIYIYSNYIRNKNNTKLN